MADIHYNTWSLECDDLEQFNKVKDMILDSKSDVDFNIIRPMPEILSKIIIIKSRGIEGIRIDDGNGELGNSGRPATPEEIEEIKKTGYDDWYDWACGNWGVKWNAFDTKLTAYEENYVEFKFKTPWGAPDKFIKYFVQQIKDRNLRKGLRFMAESYSERDLILDGYLAKNGDSE